jgi:sugar lactone lactonase YvrE
VWNVSTLAGNGSSAPFADDVGTLATFLYPSGVAADASGVVFVADSNNQRLRRVMPSGVVSTLAGDGLVGWADGAGAAARFNFLNGVAVHPLSGDVYCSDSGNQRIRRSTAAGVVTTFAGSGSAAWADGSGTRASFNQPRGIAIDAAGVIYVADTLNQRIRRISPLGAVTTLAGNGSSTPFFNGVGTSTATFLSPEGVAVDSAGNVLVSDSGNHRVRLIAPSGAVRTFAGSGSAAWGDSSGTAAAFNSPRHLAFAANGALLVADYNNQRLRLISPQGTVTTVAGIFSSGFLDGFGTFSRLNGPLGVTIDGTGAITVGDYNNLRLRRLSCVPCPPF